MHTQSLLVQLSSHSAAQLNYLLLAIVVANSSFLGTFFLFFLPFFPSDGDLTIKPTTSYVLLSVEIQIKTTEMSTTHFRTSEQICSKYINFWFASSQNANYRSMLDPHRSVQVNDKHKAQLLLQRQTTATDWFGCYGDRVRSPCSISLDRYLSGVFKLNDANHAQLRNCRTNFNGIFHQII